NALPAEYAPERADDGALTVGGSQAFLADLRRRRLELRALLERGGTLVIEPPRPATLRVHTLEAILAVPVGQALPLDGLVTEPARPRALRFAGGAPFRAFWEQAGDTLAPAVRLRAPGGEPLFHDADGSDVFGLYWAQQRGRVLLLPPPRPEHGGPYAAALLRLIEALTGELDARLPAWASAVVPPDERPARAALAQLEAERAALDQRIAAVRRTLQPLERRKLLFTAAGRALMDAVADAFWSLGCSVLQGPFGDTDLVIEHAAGGALAHVVASRDAIGPAALIPLDGWLASLAARERRPLRGLLIVNPHRDRP